MALRQGTKNQGTGKGDSSSRQLINTFYILLSIMFNRSTVVGLPHVKRDKYSIFNFLEFQNQTDDGGQKEKNKIETEKLPDKSMKLAHVSSHKLKLAN